MVNTDAWYQLPPNIDAWETVIISNLARKIPEIPTYISSVSMPKVDPVMGDADGVITLLNGLASIPITVRKCKLAPIDIMVTKSDEFYPITPAFLQKIYCDNVIGTVENPPVMGEGGEEEGSAYKVRHFRTVDSVKTASESVKSELIQKIASSNDLLTFFNTHSPDILAALIEAPQVKVASAPIQKLELPEIHFVTKEANDNYYFNGTLISARQAGELLKLANCSAEDHANLLQGGFVCLDYRSKTASVCILNNDTFAKVAREAIDVTGDNTKCYLATAYGMDGTAHRGFYIARGSDSRTLGHAFIGPDFYTSQMDVMVQDLVAISPGAIREAASPVVPLANKFGLVLPETDPNTIIGPGRITSSQKIGNRFAITFVVDGNDMDLVVGQGDFYTVPERRLSLMKNPEEMANTDIGYTAVIKSDIEGNILVEDKKLSYGNGVFELMQKYAMALDDALEVASTARAHGKALFKVAAPEDEEKAKKDKAKQESQPAQPAQQAQPAQPAQQVDPMAAQGAMPGSGSPDFDSLQDIAKVNDPQLMDTYLSANLTDVNVAGREEVMQISDDVVEAVKSLSKLLFRIRLGQIDYVKEGDVQTALNKMSEVASSLGLSSTQINTSMLNNYEGPMPTGQSSSLAENSQYSYR